MKEVPVEEGVPRRRHPNRRRRRACDRQRAGCRGRSRRGKAARHAFEVTVEAVGEAPDELRVALVAGGGNDLRAGLGTESSVGRVMRDALQGDEELDAVVEHALIECRSCGRSRESSLERPRSKTGSSAREHPRDAVCDIGRHVCSAQGLECLELVLYLAATGPTATRKTASRLFTINTPCRGVSCAPRSSRPEAVPASAIAASSSVGSDRRRWPTTSARRGRSSMRRSASGAGGKSSAAEGVRHLPRNHGHGFVAAPAHDPSRSRGQQARGERARDAPAQPADDPAAVYPRARRYRRWPLPPHL